MLINDRGVGEKCCSSRYVEPPLTDVSSPTADLPPRAIQPRPSVHSAPQFHRTPAAVMSACLLRVSSAVLFFTAKFIVTKPSRSLPHQLLVADDISSSWRLYRSPSHTETLPVTTFYFCQNMSVRLIAQRGKAQSSARRPHKQRSRLLTFFRNTFPPRCRPARVCRATTETTVLRLHY